MCTFENYLFALLVVLIPIFVYFAFFYKKNRVKVNPYLFALLCGISIIISMSYPLKVGTGYIFDLRIIPLIIAFLYGGIKLGLFSTLLIVAYRSIIGVNEGLLITILTCAVIGIFANLLREQYRLSDLKQKLMISILLVLMSNLIVVLGFLYFNLSLTDLPTFYIFLSHVFTIVLTVYIIETLAEKELNKYQIQQSERVKLIGEMAASVAHEIKNPLTVVMGFTQILKSDSNLTSRQLGSLELIDSELKRAEKIIYDYLSLAKSKESEFENINIIQVIGNVVEVTKYHAQLYGVQIMNKTQGNYFVKGNQNELTQVFLNILKNGVEAIEKEGYISISTRIIGKHIEINIIDNGKGMSEKEINLLGIPYNTTKENGTGLGMMVCYKIIDNLKGEIRVTSKLGEGTTFSIILPLVDK